MEKKVLGIFAHPDDAEIVCAGTLSLLQKAGWEVHIATMTMGDKGSAVHTSDEISRMRTAEAKNSAQVINATYHCLEFDDVYILYDRDTLNRTTALVRKVAPSLVLTHSPSDYMVDHEMTSRIVQTACFAAGVKLMEVGEEHFEPVPHLIYCDPLEGKDILGNPIQPTFYVDITQEIGIKEKMLACHASQRNWLLAHHKVDEYILAMKRFAEQRGQEINVEYAEGFRQHLGHSFPQDNILKEILGDKVILH
jgi:LmbE family N-acetylglucosaminyl deacetylase